LSPDGSNLPAGPTWSPDGKTIAVAASNSGILLVDAHTGATHPRYPGFAVSSLAWSPHGAFASTDGVEGGFIRVVDSHGTKTFPVGDFTDPNYGEVAGIASNLVWSPDGSKLAFLLSGVESGTGFFAWQIGPIRIIDLRTRRIRSVPAASSDFAWSPDGRYFIWGGLDAQITHINGHPVATLAHLRALGPSWQPLCNRSR
jgi:WD40 repeat protein